MARTRRAGISAAQWFYAQSFHHLPVVNVALVMVWPDGPVGLPLHAAKDPRHTTSARPTSDDFMIRLSD